MCLGFVTYSMQLWNKKYIVWVRSTEQNAAITAYWQEDSMDWIGLTVHTILLEQ